MRNVKDWRWEVLVEHVIPEAKDFAKAADDIREKALRDSRDQLHPLLRNVELDRLDQRYEFLRAFKRALEQNIARKLAIWLPGVQSIFSYDETSTKNWDSSIHLLVKVPRLSKAVRVLGKTLDNSLMKSLKQLGWSRFQECQTVLEVHQVTPRELRHGLGYGAMFYAVYSTPIQVWPQKGRQDKNIPR
jgi:hypothetical protein